MQPQFKTEVAGNYAIIKIIYKLEFNHTAQFSAKWKDLLAQNIFRVILDLREVIFLDSSGIGAIVSLRNELERAGGRLVLINGTNNICKVFEITGLKSRLNFTDDMGEAIEFVSG